MGVSNSNGDGGGVDGDGSGGNSPSQQGAGTETSVPLNLSSTAAVLRNFSCMEASQFRVFSLGAIYKRKDDVGGRPRGSHHMVARPEVGPCHGMVWSPPGSSLSPLWTPSSCQKNRNFGFVSSNSENIFCITFLKYKNSRKQELALWHLVNRLVPKNA
jgi:hypothetical protein